MSYNNYNRGYAEPTMTSADYMTRTYRWMALGLLITFAAAFVTATTPLFYVVNSLYLLFTIAELALVFVLSARVQNMSVGAARGVFLGYALLNGMVLSYYFLAFDLGTLVLAFLATSLYFGLMAVYGTTTHKDLSGWGPKLMMALFALIITGFVGLLFGMGFMSTVLYSGIGLVVFMLLTAYDTQKLSQLKKAISNILSNAVNYTEAGQSILVVFDKNKLSVSNECSVLPPEQLQHIFEPFYRPDLAHSQATGGNGLGLYIVQTILDKLRLKYQFVPMPNDRGMSFTIQF